MIKTPLCRNLIYTRWGSLVTLICWLALAAGAAQAQDKTQLSERELSGTDIFQLLTDPLKRNYEKICGDGSAPGKSLQHICEVVVASPVCRKSVPETDRLDCASLQQQGALSGNFWDYLKGCGNGALASIEDIWDMLKSVVDFLVTEATTQLAKSKEKVEALTGQLAATKLFVASEYQKALDESSPPFAEWKALYKVGGDLLRLLLDLVKEVIESELETFSCLNPKAQAHAICSMLFPPANVTALLKYGRAGLRKSPELKAAVEALPGKDLAKPQLAPEAAAAFPLVQQLKPQTVRHLRREYSDDMVNIVLSDGISHLPESRREKVAQVMDQWSPQERTLKQHILRSIKKGELSNDEGLGLLRPLYLEARANANLSDAQRQEKARDILSLYYGGKNKVRPEMLEGVLKAHYSHNSSIGNWSSKGGWDSAISRGEIKAIEVALRVAGIDNPEARRALIERGLCGHAPEMSHLEGLLKLPSNSLLNRQEDSEPDRHPYDPEVTPETLAKMETEYLPLIADRDRNPFNRWVLQSKIAETKKEIAQQESAKAFEELLNRPYRINEESTFSANLRNQESEEAKLLDMAISHAATEQQLIQQQIQDADSAGDLQALLSRESSISRDGHLSFRRPKTAEDIVDMMARSALDSAHQEKIQSFLDRAKQRKEKVDSAGGFGLTDPEYLSYVHTAQRLIESDQPLNSYQRRLFDALSLIPINANTFTPAEKKFIADLEEIAASKTHLKDGDLALVDKLRSYSKAVTTNPARAKERLRTQLEHTVTVYRQDLRKEGVTERGLESIEKFAKTKFFGLDDLSVGDQIELRSFLTTLKTKQELSKNMNQLKTKIELYLEFKKFD